MIMKKLMKSIFSLFVCIIFAFEILAGDLMIQNPENPESIKAYEEICQIVNDGGFINGFMK